MSVGDARRAPFCWQSIPALNVLREAWDPPESKPSLAIGLGVYRALTEVANESRARTVLGHSSAGFEATRKDIADRAGGASLKTVDRALAEIERLGVLQVERRRAGDRNLPSLYVLVEPGDALSGVGEGGDPGTPPGTEGPQGEDPGGPGVGSEGRPIQEERQEPKNPPAPLKGGDQATRASRARKGSTRQRDLDALAEIEADHERRFLDALERTPETEAAWSKVATAIKADTPDSTFALWFEPITLVGEVAGQLVVSAPAPVRAWVERRYLPKLNALISEASGYGGVCFVDPQAEAAEAVA